MGRVHFDGVSRLLDHLDDPLLRVAGSQTVERGGDADSGLAAVARVDGDPDTPGPVDAFLLVGGHPSVADRLEVVEQGLAVGDRVVRLCGQPVLVDDSVDTLVGHVRPDAFRLLEEGRVGTGLGLWAGCLRDAVVVDRFGSGVDVVDAEREAVPRRSSLDPGLAPSEIAGVSASAVPETSVNARHRI